MDTDSLYLALVDENLEECILLEKKFQCTQIRRNDRRDVFIANAKQNFSHLHAVHKKQDKGEPGYVVNFHTIQ